MAQRRLRVANVGESIPCEEAFQAVVGGSQGSRRTPGPEEDTPLNRGHHGLEVGQTRTLGVVHRRNSQLLQAAGLVMVAVQKDSLVGETDSSLVVRTVLTLPQMAERILRLQELRRR